MADDDPLLREVAQQSRNVSGGVSARANLSVDVTQIRNLNAELKTLKKHLDDIKKNLPDIVRDMNKMLSASGGVSGGKGKGGSGVIEGVSASIKRSEESAGGEVAAAGGGKGGRLATMVAKFGAGGGGAKGAGIAAVAQALAPVAAAGVAALDKRIDRGAAYALSADRMSMVYQQMTGLSQAQVQDKYRQPLTNYRLGVGGINTLLGLQAETGLNAAKQASSVQALRTVSGNTLSTGDVANMMSAMARPETVNKMFMMTGQSLYGFGGRQNTMMGTIQNIVRATGLTNKSIVDSAFQPGSVTRDRLRMSGVPEDMINTVLQYARENITYKEKGGRGMYDPSKKEQRKKMGVEDNYAEQFEETTRVKEKREEQFYSRQADNLSDMEKATQAVTRALGKLEDKLSGLVGARTSTRPYQKAAGGFLKGLGGIAKIAGAAAMFVPGGQAVGLGLGLLAAGAAADIGGGVISGTGDGDFDKGTSDQSKKTSTSNSKTSTSKESNTKAANKPYMSMRKYRGLKPKFAERLYAMLKANSRVHIETGWRSSKVQENLFLSRYQRTDEKTDLFWDGSYWKHVRGPEAAPPGRSMHEIGLAADLKGDLGWVQENAHKFGLKTFAKVNNEPWHVQPEELPNSRREYEKSGAPWGTDPSSRDDGRPSTSPAKPKESGDAEQGSGKPTDGSSVSTPPSSASDALSPSNTGTASLSVTKKKPTDKSLPKMGSKRLMTYSGSSISSVLAQSRLRTAATSIPYTQVNERIHEGDGSFYNGMSDSNNAQAPVFTIPTRQGGSTMSTTSSTIQQSGDTFHISPNINFYGGSSGISTEELRRISREVGRLIEEEARRRATRRN